MRSGTFLCFANVSSARKRTNNEKYRSARNSASWKTALRLLQNVCLIIVNRPIDFLGIDRDRLATMFVFGAAAGSIFILATKFGIQGRNAWENGVSTNLIGMRYQFRGLIKILCTYNCQNH